MIAAFIVLGLMGGAALIITISVKLIQLNSGYKRFQVRDDTLLGYATIDYSTLKRLYQVNPDGYILSDYGQLYRLKNNHGWTTREVRICFKTFSDYCQFIIDKNNKEKRDKILKRNNQESEGLSRLRDLAQQDIDNLRRKLDEEFEQEKKKNEAILTSMRRPVGNLKPLVTIAGTVGCYCGKPVYVDEKGYYFTKDGTPITVPWEE